MVPKHQKLSASIASPMCTCGMSLVVWQSHNDKVLGKVKLGQYSRSTIVHAKGDACPRWIAQI